MTLTETKKEDHVEILVEGKVDTNTAPQLQAKILQCFQKTNNLVLDMEQCPYMSSAGLRALLLGQKTASSKGGSMKLIHVCEVVMKIFSVSRFDKVLTIE